MILTESSRNNVMSMLFLRSVIWSTICVNLPNYLPLCCPALGHKEGVVHINFFFGEIAQLKVCPKRLAASDPLRDFRRETSRKVITVLIRKL
jgi:hypothetical protein